MSEKEYDRFFELLDKIVAGDGIWREKRDKVLKESAARASDGNLEEFAGWFVEE